MAQSIADTLRLHVKPLPPQGWLTYDSRGLLLGSCFANEIGHRLLQDGFDVFINPYGTSYNPITTLASLNLTWPEVEAGLVQRDSGFTSHAVHSDVWGRTIDLFKENFLERQALLETRRESIDWLSVTLGTAWVYERKADGYLCANQHKQPANAFSKRLLNTQEIIDKWMLFLNNFQKASLTKSLVTVSPVVHGRDGLSENSLSKSVLRLAAHTLTEISDTTYFPALEIIRDELRDYRFYAEDMMHPTAQAVDIVYQRFLSHALAPSAYETLKAFKAIQSFAQHRPTVLNKEKTEAHLKALQLLPIALPRKAEIQDLLKARLGDD